MKTLFTKTLCLGLAVGIGLQPAIVTNAAANPPVDTTEAGKILVELDRRLQKDKSFTYLDAEGEPTDYVKAFESKKPFFLVPAAGTGFQKDRLLGMFVKGEPGAIVVHVSVYDQSEGFAKKKIKGAAKLEFGPKGGDLRAITDRIDTEMKSITSQLVATTTEPGDRKVAASSCIETKIINYTITAGILAGVALGIEMSYKLFIRKAPTPQGFIIYRFWGGITAAAIGLIIVGVSALVRHFRCDEIKGY